jgi:hypothetical protein
MISSWTWPSLSIYWNLLQTLGGMAAKSKLASLHTRIIVNEGKHNEDRVPGKTSLQA